jgi:glycosyltransferase involved in cell wall biosynthesis
MRAVPPGTQVIVVDDGSTDRSTEIAGSHPVTLVRLPSNRGASAARNAGIAASDAPLIAFVDADVVLRPDALTRLLAPLADPEVLGTNGLLTLDLRTPGLVTAFTNTSIHYQHLAHGLRIASAFTSLCVFRRETLARMGGWEEATSRFADDVATRWHLPEGSLRLVPEAQGEHLKRVSLRGLLKHRFNVGYFYWRSLLVHRRELRERPAIGVLALRYPLNTLLATTSLVVLPFAAWPSGRAALAALALGFVLANMSFAAFTLRHRGALEALAAVPISTLEGFAYSLGMAWSATVALRRRHVRATTTSRPVRAPVREGGAGEPPRQP